MAQKIKHRGPNIACEITPERVIAARLGDGSVGIETYTARSLKAGAVVPSLSEPNIANVAAVREAVREALETVTGRSRDLVAILPDTAVRIALLDFDSLTEKRAEAENLIRFRLKKILPFDVDQSSMSYEAVRSVGNVKVIAAVALNSVIAEYENLFRELGYQPGIVLPSILAALGNVSASGPSLVIKAEANHATVAIVGNSKLLLLRTLENSQGSNYSPEDVVEAVYPSLVFFQDTYGMQVERVLVGGNLKLELVKPALETQTGVPIQELISDSFVGTLTDTPRSWMAGVVGALIS